MSDRQKIKLNHNIYIPEGAEDLSYDEKFVDEHADQEISTINEGEGNDSLTPSVPETFTIISQTLRETKSGEYVIDVVAQTDDYAETVEIEVRLTNA